MSEWGRLDRSELSESACLEIFLRAVAESGGRAPPALSRSAAKEALELAKRCGANMATARACLGVAELVPYECPRVVWLWEAWVPRQVRRGEQMSFPRAFR